MRVNYRYHWGVMSWAIAMGLLMAPAVMAQELSWSRGVRQAESEGERIPQVVPQQLRCQDQPSGFGLPGFQPGTPKPQVERLIGAPAAVQRGYWGNSTALVYYLIPNQVSLGFLFDDKSNVLQQTEASFHHGLELPLVLSTLDSMLGCQLDEAIEGGFYQVWERETPQYRFQLSAMEGVIFWESDTHVYIGVWQQGFQ
ncbi:MAG: hypothetical protein EA395_05345 [Phormidium sp. GEM2.Bin31]|nr:MAG: hypothetical protein EA395_05345 [Phormidium sp. GEM2.Bin31]